MFDGIWTGRCFVEYPRVGRAIRDYYGDKVKMDMSFDTRLLSRGFWPWISRNPATMLTILRRAPSRATMSSVVMDARFLARREWIYVYQLCVSILFWLAIVMVKEDGGRDFIVFWRFRSSIRPKLSLFHGRPLWCVLLLIFHLFLIFLHLAVRLHSTIHIFFILEIVYYYFFIVV